MSPLDVEKELFRLKRTMGAYYSRGQYNEALVVAQALESEVVNIWGSNTAVHASCMVDVGTMLKSLGEFDEAMELYQKALPLYQQYYGKNNKSYINTLTNIGTLYKSIAETKKEENEYLENINHAEINLAEALSLRKELAGPTARDVLINENHYAMILKAKGLLDEALEKLNQILEVCMTTHGELDTITAITQNNIGIILKSQKKYDEAEEFYSKAYKTRKDVIGERHRDTIITLHNLAELYAAKGETEKSNQVRQEIMTLIGQEYQPENWSDENIVTSLPSTVRLPENSLQDHRPTLDELLEEKKRREENLTRNGLL